MVLKQRWTRKTLKMRLHMQKYATYVRIYVNFWICSICDFKNVIICEKMRYASFGKICNRILIAYNQHP